MQPPTQLAKMFLSDPLFDNTLLISAVKQADHKNVRTATATMTAKTLPPKLFDPLSIKSFEPALFVELLPLPPPCEKEVPVGALPAAVPVDPLLPSVPDEPCSELVLLSWPSLPEGLVPLPFPGTVAMLEAEAPAGMSTLMLVPVPRRDLSTVGLLLSMTVSLVPAALL